MASATTMHQSSDGCGVLTYASLSALSLPLPSDVATLLSSGSVLPTPSLQTKDPALHVPTASRRCCSTAGAATHNQHKSHGYQHRLEEPRSTIRVTTSHAHFSKTSRTRALVHFSLLCVSPSQSTQRPCRFLNCAGIRQHLRLVPTHAGFMCCGLSKLVPGRHLAACVFLGSHPEVTVMSPNLATQRSCR